jgi:hypothetical protein
MENKSYSIQVGPHHIHHTRWNLHPSPYKQFTPSSTWRRQVSRAAPRQETYLVETHICKNRSNWPMTLHQMCCLLAQKSKPSTSNKILIYKATLKPIWTYGLQLWGMASTSNIEILIYKATLKPIWTYGIQLWGKRPWGNHRADHATPLYP